MTVLNGCTGKIFISETENDPFVFVGELNSWSVNFGFTADAFRPLGGYYPNRGISASNWSFSFAGYFDPTDPGQSLLAAGVLRYCKVYPIGDNAPTTDPIIEGYIYIESLDSSGSPDDLLSLSFSGTGSSPLIATNSYIGE
jgi:hypothetical protein